MKRLLGVISIIFIVSLTANAQTRVGQNMILLDNNQLSKIDARGADKFLRVNIENPKIILCDEQFINNNAQLHLENQNKSSITTNNTNYFGYKTDNAFFE